MDIKVVRDRAGKMRHVVHVRRHEVEVDELESNGGEDSGPTAHDLYDAALGACKAMTMLWYANRKHIPVEDIEVTVSRDDSGERGGTLAFHKPTSARTTGRLRSAARSPRRSVRSC